MSDESISRARHWCRTSVARVQTARRLVCRFFYGGKLQQFQSHCRCCLLFGIARPCPHIIFVQASRIRTGRVGPIPGVRHLYRARRESVPSIGHPYRASGVHTKCKASIPSFENLYWVLRICSGRQASVARAPDGARASGSRWSKLAG